MPEPGAKKRETKSHPGVDARLVTITPRTGSVAQRAKSGWSARTVVFRFHFHEIVELAASHVRRRAPSASSRPAGRVGRCDRAWPENRARSIRRRGVAVSTPLFVWNAAVWSRAQWPPSHSACALASVAWPHSSTSTAGVNQRRRTHRLRDGTRNAVSERFISAATFCIHAASAAAGSRTTAAGIARKRAVGERIDLKDGKGHEHNLQPATRNRQLTSDN